MTFACCSATYLIYNSYRVSRNCMAMLEDVYGKHLAFRRVDAEGHMIILFTENLILLYTNC